MTNQGGNPTEDAVWYDQVYLASGTDPNASGYLREYLATVQHSGILARDASYTATATWVLSPALSGKVIIVETNARRTTDPAHEPDRFGYYTWEGQYTTNNVEMALTDITRVTPDLQVASVVAQQPAYSGEKINVTWTVQNVGNAPVWHGTSHWYDAVYVSRDPVFDIRRATVLGKFIHNNTTPLGAGASYSNTQEVTLPPGIEGNYYIYVFTDIFQDPDSYITTPGRKGEPYDDGNPLFFYNGHVWEGGTFRTGEQQPRARCLAGRLPRARSRGQRVDGSHRNGLFRPEHPPGMDRHESRHACHARG